MYTDKLDEIVNKYNKMKPVDTKNNTYINFGTESNNKDLKIQVGHYVRISEYKNIFAKGYNANWSKVFVIKKVENTLPWTYVISDLNGEENVGMFYEKQLLKKTNQKEFRIDKVTKREGNIYVKWKGYDHLFNSWIDKKDIA